ncbi:MAG: 50S ribosomal protein L4 [Sphingomonas sp.]|jgi:large subunit ribosomal protein L4|uniref:50S ribosomal protein L4 n=1 Tax=Sphingomonas sp. TaxID=28214 RepID=UPI000A098586|nr:50S ribosomal protein L4 [Sphingomonas sp.]MBX9880790.1 50S ribosomal protein L4 [Sphingomonas sp.]OQW46686.1 MAG: 50S ribosomal protein L4 [Proteobacteria bacterium SG_bin6]
MKIQVSTFEGDCANGAAEIELRDDVFGLEPRADILHRVITWQLEKRRGTARGTRERADVARTGKKFGRQKGGGTARHGDRRAPVFIGGGKAHGARVRDFNPSLNKKIRALGLKMALSAKAKDGKLIVMDSLAIDGGKTAALAKSFQSIGAKHALVIDGDVVEPSFALAAGNIHAIDVLPAMGANVYDILKADTLVLSRAAVEKLEARFNG